MSVEKEIIKPNCSFDFEQTFPNGIIPNDMNIKENYNPINETLVLTKLSLSQSKDTYFRISNLLNEVYNDGMILRFIKSKTKVANFLSAFIIILSFPGFIFLAARLLYVYFGIFLNTNWSYNFFNNQSIISFAFLSSSLVSFTFVINKLTQNFNNQYEEMVKKIIDKYLEIGICRELYQEMKNKYGKYWKAIGEDWLTLNNISLISQKLESGDYEKWGDILENSKLTAEKLLIPSDDLELEDIEKKFSFNIFDKLIEDTNYLNNVNIDLGKFIKSTN